MSTGAQGSNRGYFRYCKYYGYCRRCGYYYRYCGYRYGYCGYCEHLDIVVETGRRV